MHQTDFGGSNVMVIDDGLGKKNPIVDNTDFQRAEVETEVINT